jgi:hypothetical protein
MTIAELHEAAQAPGEDGFFAAAELLGQIERAIEARRQFGSGISLKTAIIASVCLGAVFIAIGLGVGAALPWLCAAPIAGGCAVAILRQARERQHRATLASLEIERQEIESLALSKRWPELEAAAASAGEVLHDAGAVRIKRHELVTAVRTATGPRLLRGKMPVIAVSDVTAQTETTHALFSQS